MANNRKTQVVITCNAAVAKKVMEELQQRIDQIKDKMKALDVTTKEGQKEFKKLEKELVSYNSAIEQNIPNSEKVKNAIENLSNTSLKKLREALSAAKSELGKMAASSSGLKQAQKNVQILQEQVDKLSGTVKKSNNSWSTALKNIAAYGGIFQAFNKGKELLTSAIRKNYEYSGSLTDIRKVSGLAGKDIDELSRKLATIETRTSIDGLAQLAYQGAKLGMQEHGGAEGLYQFVKAADQINVAIGEEMGDDALPALSKLVETMGLIPKMGIEKAMLATGSAMFKLSTTSTSTANNIVEFSKRMTGVSRTAGITTDQLLALASASDALFLMPEVASTAMSKFVVALQKNHNLIEKDLAIPAGTIKNLYAAGNAMDAVVLVLEKMRDKGNMNALGDIFKDLGSDGQRLITSMVTLSKNVDVLKDHLYTSQEAFEEATAVTAEYVMQQSSAIGILDRANNLWEKAFVNPEGVNMVKSLAQVWYDVSRTFTSQSTWLYTLQWSLQRIIESLKLLIFLLPAITNMLMLRGVASAAMGVYNMYDAIRGAILKTTTAQVTLNAAMKANIFAVVAGAALTLIGYLISVANRARDVARAQKEAEERANAWKNKMKDAQVETDNLTRKLNSYKAALDNASLSQEMRDKQIARFNKEFRPYINKLGVEIKNVSDLKKHYKELAAEIQRATYYRMREEARSAAQEPNQKSRVASAFSLRTYLEQHSNNFGGYTIDAIKELFNKGANANWIYQQMAKAASGGKNYEFDLKSGTFRYDLGNTRMRSSGYTELLKRLRWFENSARKERKIDEEVNNYFKDFVPDDYVPYIEDEVGTLENEKPDKKALKEAREELRKQKAEWRKELKEAQTEARGIVDKIKNYYDRQILEVTRKANEMNLDEADTEALVDPVRMRMNEALSVARKAISEVEDGWDTFKQTMQGDMLEGLDENGLNESQLLLDQIEKADIDALREKIKTLSKQLNKPDSALIDQVWRGATANEQNNASLEQKRREEQNKILLERSYTAKVDQSTTEKLKKLKLLTLNAEQAQTLLGGGEEAQAMVSARAAQIAEMLKNARENIVELYQIDVEKEGGGMSLMKLLFPNGESDASEIEGIFKLTGNNLKTFYDELIKHYDEYQSEIKKRRDEKMKNFNDRWTHSKKGIALDADIQNFDRLLAMQEVFGRMEMSEDGKQLKTKSFFGGISQDMGFSESEDPETALLLKKYEEQKAIYEQFALMYKNDADMQAEMQEKKKAFFEAGINYMKSLSQQQQAQFGNMMSFLAPIQQFGWEMGEAFATMTSDAEEGRKKIKNALKSMVTSFAQSTLEIIKQNLIYQMNTALTYSTVESTATAHGAAMTAIENTTQTSVNTAHMAGSLTYMGVALGVTLSDVALSQARAIAKCFATLGPIGGALAVSAVMAAISAALSFAINSLFGSGDTNTTDTTAKTTNTRLTSGMLTYDRGNVQELKPFFDKKGEMYWATEEDSLNRRGVSLYTQPTATTVNGKPSLIAEEGPELVIGRETTAAMMQDNPRLLKMLYAYDKHHSGRTAYDVGNVSELASDGNLLPASAGEQTVAVNADKMYALMAAILNRLNNPIPPEINMYGPKGLHKRIQEANQFMKYK